MGVVNSRTGRESTEIGIKNTNFKFICCLNKLII